MRQTVLFIFTIFLMSGFTAPDFAVKTYTLEEALAKKIVEIAEVTSPEGGTHNLKLQLKNLHKRQDLKIHIPQGTQFASRDSSEQDVIIMVEKYLIVKAGTAASVKLAGYCTQATYRSPKQGAAFELKTTANEALMKLADYLKLHKDFGEYMYQHAIWVITDDHDLRGLHHDDPVKALAMHKFMSDLTGKPMPKYTVLYDDGTPGEVAFTGYMVMIYGDFEYDLDKDCTMTCEIYNEAGEMVQSVFKDMQQRKGHSKITFKLKARDLPKGKYTSKLFKDGTLYKEMMVEV